MAFDDVVDLLEKTQVVAIVTTRANGDPVATPIWSMVVEGVPYLRSAYGPGSWWYRHVQAGRPVAFVLGDGCLAERDRGAALQLPREVVSTSNVPAADEVQGQIDEEIAGKYAGSPQPAIDAMLSAEAKACTLRIGPAPH